MIMLSISFSTEP